MPVIGTAGTEKGLKMVEEQGALALNHHDPKYLDRDRWKPPTGAVPM